MLDRQPLSNILVATDFSTRAHLAMERACRLPMADGAIVTLLHVVSHLQTSLFPRADNGARARLEAWAADARGKLSPRAEVRVAVEVDEPFSAICRRTERDHADLIVVGRHGHHDWPRDVLGSTAERVIRCARTAVLVVVAPARDAYKRLLVAVDDPDSVVHGVELMARIAPDVHRALAVHVLDVAWSPTISQYGVSEPEIDRVLRSRTQETQERIERALGELGGTELSFEVRLVEGSPREAIMQAARGAEADLVVVGTHGRSKLDQLLFGSVAERTIRNADIDVLVAHAPAN